MPSKSKRAATRQAKLREKKRRGKAAPQVFEVGPTERALDDSEEEAEARPVPVTAAAAPRASAVPARPPRMSRRAREAQATDVAATYPYMGSELKRIAVVAAFIFAIIISLTFVLG